MDPRKAIELEGKIISVLAGTMFRVELANEHLVLAHISGKMRKRFIRLTIGDRVKLEMSPYDTGKTIEERLWAAAKVKNHKLTCPHCLQVHIWTKKDVVLAR